MRMRGEVIEADFPGSREYGLARPEILILLGGQKAEFIGGKVLKYQKDGRPITAKVCLD